MTSHLFLENLDYSMEFTNPSSWISPRFQGLRCESLKLCLQSLKHLGLQSLKHLGLQCLKHLGLQSLKHLGLQSLKHLGLQVLYLALLNKFMIMEKFY